MIHDALKLKAILACFAIIGMVGWVFAILAYTETRDSLMMYVSYAGAILVGLYLLLNILVFNCYKFITYKCTVNGRVVKRGGGRIHLAVAGYYIYSYGDDDDDGGEGGEEEEDDDDDGDDGDDGG